MLYRTKHFYLFNIPTNSNNHLTGEKDDIKKILITKTVNILLLIAIQVSISMKNFCGSMFNRKKWLLT